MKETILSWMNTLIIYLYCYKTICEKHYDYINNNSIKRIKIIKNHKRKSLMNFQISSIIYIAKYSNMIFGNVPYMCVCIRDVFESDIEIWYFDISEYLNIREYFNIREYLNIGREYLNIGREYLNIGGRYLNIPLILT